MRGPLLDILEGLMEESAGWLVLLCGMTILAGAVLVPQWWSNREQTARRDLMTRQLQQMDDQRLRYSQFHAALEEDDPLLLERLAYSQLHWRPAEGELWSQQSAVATTSNSLNYTGLCDDLLAQSASVDAVLTEPGQKLRAQPTLKQEQPTRLVRLTSGFSRWVLLAAGLMFTIAGLGMGEKSI
ncbi:MAG: hypothetical protein IT445_05110 [Phycisphaeraceae bacterium]|nr:hypothetical protein [Phycisphaeraceae bacterium]